MRKLLLLSICWLFWIWQVHPATIEGTRMQIFQVNESDNSTTLVGDMRVSVPRIDVVSSTTVSTTCQRDQMWFHYDVMNKLDTTFRVKFTGIEIFSMGNTNWRLRTNDIMDYNPRRCTLYFKYGAINEEYDCRSVNAVFTVSNVPMDGVTEITYEIEFTTPSDPAFKYANTEVFFVDRISLKMNVDHYARYTTDSAYLTPVFPEQDFSYFRSLMTNDRSFFKQYYQDSQTFYNQFPCDWVGVLCNFVGTATPYISGICLRGTMDGHLYLDLKELDQIEYVIFDNNFLDSLNVSVSNANHESIKVLSVAGNDLTELKFELLCQGLPNIEEISMSSQPILVNQIVDLTGVSNHLLTKLYLANVKISVMADISTSFPNLQYLDLSRNSLTSTSFDGIFSLTNLIRLDIAYNDFSAVELSATEVGVAYFFNKDNFQFIEYMDISNNGLQGQMTCLQNIEELHIDRNNFAPLSETGFLGCTMSNLRILHMEYVKFDTFRIPDFATYTPNLEELDIDYSDFSSGQVNSTPFPQSLRILEARSCSYTVTSLWGLENLYQVILNSNTVPSFSTLVSSSTQLYDFQCTSCGISTVWPDNFGDNFPHIQRLTLSNNVIKQLNFEVPVPSLEYIYMSNCEIDSVGNISSSLPSLWYLYLSNNLITDISEFPPSLKYLYLSDNLLTNEDWSNTFYDLPALERLYINNNRLFADIGLFAPNTTNLRYLYMENCALFGIPNRQFYDSIFSTSSAFMYFKDNYIQNNLTLLNFSAVDSQSVTASLFETQNYYCTASSTWRFDFRSNAIQGFAKKSLIDEECGTSSNPTLILDENPVWCFFNETTSTEYPCVQFKIFGPFYFEISRYKVNPEINVEGSAGLVGQKICPSVQAVAAADSFSIPCEVALSTTVEISILGGSDSTTLFEEYGGDENILIVLEFDLGNGVSIETADIVVSVNIVEECPDGLYLVETDTLDYCGCDRGESGTNGVIDDCSQCVRGKFASSQGQMICEICKMGYYSDEPGSEICKKCPANTQTTYNVLSTNISSCLCVPGYYGADPTKCRACPVGGTCPGGTEFPNVASGYWRYPDEPDVFYQCNPPEACEATTGLDPACKEGYTGDLCGICIEKEYYKMGGYCHECPGYAGYMFAFMIGIILFGTCVLLYHSQPRLTKLHSLGIVLTWLQLISLFGSIPAYWPEGVERTYNILSFTNMNIELFSPECSVTMNYWSKLYIKLLSPLIFIALLFTMYCIQYTVGKQFPWVQAFFNTPFFETLRFKCGESGYGRHHKDMFLKSRYVYAFCVLIIALYTLLASTSTEPFNCVEQSNGVFTMARNPSQECFDKDWYFHIKFILIFNVVYIIGIPLSSLILLFRNRKVIFEPKFLNVFGGFVLPYRTELYYWEVINLSRRSVMIFVIDFGQFLGSEFIQLFLMITILFAYLVVQVFWSPYRTQSNNKLTFVWITTSTFCLFSGVIFRSAEAVPSAENEAFGYLVGAMFAFAAIYSIRSVGRELRDNLYMQGKENEDNKNAMFLRDERSGVLQTLFPASFRLIWAQMAYQTPKKQEIFFEELDNLLHHHDTISSPLHERNITWTQNELFSVISEDSVLDHSLTSVISRRLANDPFNRNLDESIHKDHVVVAKSTSAI